MCAGRILFVEDQYDVLKDYLKIFEKVNLVDEKQRKDISRYKGDTSEDNFNNFNKVLQGRIEAATCFEDAFSKIQSAGNGNEYEYFFIDRNLASFSDIHECLTSSTPFKNTKKDFTKPFFAGFNPSGKEGKWDEIYVGDYLIISLLNAGVPIEKVYFLTGNPNEHAQILKSPYLHSERLPKCIDKKDGNFQNQLENILRESYCAKIRFLYHEIFNNKKVEDIFGPYINGFITMLAKRYEKGSVTFEKNNGIILRNMIEAVVAYIPKPDDQTVRNFLNNTPAYYSLFNKFNTPWNVKNYYEKKQKLPIDDKNQIKNFLSNLKNPKKNNSKSYPTDEQQEQEADNMIKYATAIQIQILGKMQNLDIPKYIFSYIDNIYTVTSEISAHGQNDKTTEGLCADGWSALLSGMIQIMQWVAETNPNKSSSAN